MPQLLLELFSEEIPARMQAAAARDLERLARDKLAAEGLLPEALKTFAGARRLTLVAEGLPPAQKDRHEELKGPKVGAPPQALEGFLRKTGLTQEQLTERDGVFFAHVHKPGRPTPEIVAEMVEQIVRAFPWPKSMVSGTSKLRWVRPLRRILCVFDGEVVPFEIDGIPSGNLAEGHRFMSDGQPFLVKDFEGYAHGLSHRSVVLDVEERKEKIVEAAKTLCFARNLELVEDAGLLDEVAGLVEWPVPVLGDMDPEFLDLPPEVIRTSMRVHQRYFAVRDPKTGKLAPHFLTVANIQARDGGQVIAKGNAKVLSARLSDARFFWNEDRKTRLEDRLEKLKGVTFHAKLGTMHDRVERLVAIAGVIAPMVGADPALAQQAALLAKADLVSGVVGEFPELQGIMGGYYATKDGLGDAVAVAIREQYKPQGPNDTVPSEPVAIAVALTDKIELLIGFFGIGEAPTGSRDPFGLRRAALGVVRTILENRLRVPLRTAFGFNFDGARVYPNIFGDDPQLPQGALLNFFADRLKVQLREQGQRHDLVDAVLALGDDDLVRIVAKVEALDAFLRTEDGANLLAGYKRAVNILKAEEKKGPLPTGEPAQMGGAPAEEVALVTAVEALDGMLDGLIEAEDFAAAMAELATLRGPVDAFFDKVLVNSDDPAERDNRLRLLAKVRDAMGRVADFSQVTG